MALYDPSLVKDNCGFGLIAHMQGQPSHKLVRTAISALDRMTHRGGINSDGKTGDGCGLLLQKPDSYFRLIAEENEWNLGKQYAVGMMFLSKDPVKAQSAKDIINQELSQETLTIAAGVMCQPMKTYSVLSHSVHYQISSKFSSLHQQVGANKM